MTNLVKLSQSQTITESSSLEISFKEIENALGFNLSGIEPRTHVKLRIYDGNQSEEVILYRSGKKKLLRLSSERRPNFLLGVIPEHIYIGDLVVLKTTEPKKGEQEQEFEALRVGELREALAYLPADFIVMTGPDNDPDAIFCFPDRPEYVEEDIVYIPTRFYL